MIFFMYIFLSQNIYTMAKRTHGIPCHICSEVKGELYEVQVDGKTQSEHIKCPKCIYCHHTVSPFNGEVVVKNNLSGTYEHKSCPLCDKCGQPGRENDKIDRQWDGFSFVHQSCRMCQLCGKGDNVERWPVDNVDGVPYAHRECLEKVICTQ